MTKLFQPISWRDSNYRFNHSSFSKLWYNSWMLKFSIQWKHLKSNREIIIKVCRAQQNIKRGCQFITKKLFFDISSLSWRQQGKMKNEISNDQKTYLIKEFLLIQLLRPKILTLLSDWLFKQIKQFWPRGHKNLRARFASGAAML